MCLKKLNLSILHWVSHLANHLKKNNVKNIAKSESHFNYDSKYTFYKFYKVYDEFEEMSLDSKHNKIKEFNKKLHKFNILKSIKSETQVKKE